MTPWTVAHQALPSMGLPRQEYCHCLLQGLLPTRGLNLHLLHLLHWLQLSILCTKQTKILIAKEMN